MAFTPGLWPNTNKSFNLIDTLAVSVDRIQRNFEPMRRRAPELAAERITDERAKLILYEALAEGNLEGYEVLPESTS